MDKADGAHSSQGEQDRPSQSSPLRSMSESHASPTRRRFRACGTIRQGWLEKEDPNGLIFKQWKRRYFKLTSDAIVYSKTEEGESLREVSLSNVKQVHAHDVKGRSGIFMVATNLFLSDGKPRVYILQVRGRARHADVVLHAHAERVDAPKGKLVHAMLTAAVRPQQAQSDGDAEGWIADINRALTAFRQESCMQRYMCRRACGIRHRGCCRACVPRGS
jgi:hypothetical protein